MNKKLFLIIGGILLMGTAHVNVWGIECIKLHNQTTIPFFFDNMVFHDPGYIAPGDIVSDRLDHSTGTTLSLFPKNTTNNTVKKGMISTTIIPCGLNFHPQWKQYKLITTIDHNAEDRPPNCLASDEVCSVEIVPNA